MGTLSQVLLYPGATLSPLIYPSATLTLNGHFIPSLPYPELCTLSLLLLYPGATLSLLLNFKLEVTLYPSFTLSQATLSHIIRLNSVNLTFFRLGNFMFPIIWDLKDMHMQNNAIFQLFALV